MCGNPTEGDGYPLNTFRPQGLPYGFSPSTTNPSKPCASSNPRYSFHNIRNSTLGGWNSLVPPCLLFLETLKLLDLLKLTNDPIHYKLAWPLVPNKLRSDIPKFEGNSREDLAYHTTKFHLWCSSNSLVDDSIGLRLFQCTLTGNTVKWYIELRGGSFATFF